MDSGDSVCIRNQAINWPQDRLTIALAPRYTRYAMTSRIFLALRGQLFVLSLLLSAALPVFAQPPAGDVRIHYYRPDGNYSGWGVYAWNAATANYSWCSSQVA